MLGTDVPTLSLRAVSSEAISFSWNQPIASSQSLSCACRRASRKDVFLFSQSRHPAQSLCPLNEEQSFFEIQNYLSIDPLNLSANKIFG